MSRPTDRMTSADAAGECDEARGEFWLGNPWHVGETAHNLSAYEPNQLFLNLGNMRFANVSFVTGTDDDGDGRGVAILDATGDLQPDLVVRQSGGGAIRVYANRLPPASRLEVSLRGTKSNSLGIGARIVARHGEVEVVRQVFPANNFLVTQGSTARFGLGGAERVSLTVHWPSGAVQEIEGVPVGRHVRITEGAQGYETLLQTRN